MYSYEIAKKIAEETNRGFWGAAGSYFFEKAECLRHATQNKTIKITYDFHNDVYNSLDWAREPQESLEELYIERAHQLRDKYDYLVLAFSGGSDCSNILDTFLENNIKLDEVITYYPVSAVEKLLHKFNGDADDEKNHMFEYVTAALPRLKLLSQTHPNIKITLIDYAQSAVEAVDNQYMDMYGTVGLVGPVMMGHRKVVEHVAQHSDKKSTCIIIGVDKPRVLYHKENKKFATFFSDTLYFGRFSNKVFGGFEPTVEFFYWSKDLPRLVQKQCFVLKKVIEPMLDKDTCTMPDQQLYVDHGSTLFFDPNQEFYKRLLYKNWNSSIWQVKKTKGLFYMGQCAWFHSTDLVDSRLKDFYAGQLKDLLNGIHKFLIRYENGIPLGFQSYHTPLIWF